ncbi:MAG: hypothetical protein M3407_07695 [Acidobacteriota bacterium]|jgi:hypothetical protein|nr:hypothetical protein [Acidobacteriota bacterium]
MPLFAACAFSAACSGPKNNNYNNQPSPTPSASQTPEPSPTARYDFMFLENGERPIIVSGGSVDIDFNHDYFVRDPSMTNKFVCSGCKIDKYEMREEEEASEDGAVVEYRAGPDPATTAISIKAKHGSTNQNIEVRDVASNVEMTFTTTSAGYNPRPYSSRRHFSKKFKVRQVFINGSETACKEGGSSADCGKYVKSNKKYTILVLVKKR